MTFCRNIVRMRDHVKLIILKCRVYGDCADDGEFGKMWISESEYKSRRVDLGLSSQRTRGERESGQSNFFIVSERIYAWLNLRMREGVNICRRRRNYDFVRINKRLSDREWIN